MPSPLYIKMIHAWYLHATDSVYVYKVDCKYVPVAIDSGQAIHHCVLLG